MYNNFYQLSQAPFNVTPDVTLFFQSPSHKEALASLIYGIEKRKGFIAVIGEVGLGKTTAVRTCLAGLDRERIKTVYAFNANITFEGLISTIYQELEIPEKPDDLFDAVNKLHHVLVEEYKEERNVVLIIDEAHNMPTETLENLRMLSNLETWEDKLIQIVLVGQPELQDRLNRHELRQLKQRIAIRHTIVPLSEKESFDYIQFRLSKVATRKEPIFTQGALKQIIKYSKGVPRTLNILCDNALIAGFGYQIKPVTSKIVKEVIRDFERTGKRSVPRWAFAPAALLFALLVFYLVFPHRTQDTQSRVGNENARSGQVAQEAAGTSGSKEAPQAMGTASPAKDVVEGPRTTEPSAPLHQRSVQASRDEPESVVNRKGLPPQEQPAREKTGAVTGYPVSQVSSKKEGEGEWTGLLRAFESPLGREKSHAGPRAAQPGTVPAASDSPRMRLVKDGDTLRGLVRDVYGFVDKDLIDTVKQSNPLIFDVDRIRAGSTIFFPELGKQGSRQTTNQSFEVPHD